MKIGFTTVCAPGHLNPMTTRARKLKSRGHDIVFISVLNTVLECLTQGVPMVAIPVTNDQPGVAARIAHTKTGAFVPLKELTAPRLSSLIDDVLTNPEYGQHACNMRQAIAETNGLERAADLLEQVFDLRAPVIPNDGLFSPRAG